MASLATGFVLLFLQAPALDEQLLEAARKGDLPAVQALLAKGANIETQSRYGQTPLFFAARNGHAPNVRNPVGEVMMGTPAVTKGTLVIRTMKRLVAVGETAPGSKPAGAY